MEVRYTPTKGVYQRYLPTCAIPHENKGKWVRYPLCDTVTADTISKGYCAIWGGISRWAAKGRSGVAESGLLEAEAAQSGNHQKSEEWTVSLWSSLLNTSFRSVGTGFKALKGTFCRTLCLGLSGNTFLFFFKWRIYQI